MAERLYSLEVKKNPEIEYLGFTKDQQNQVSHQTEAIGLPMDNVRRFVYRPGQKGEENVLGSFQPYDGTLTLYKSLENLPPVAQQGTMVHELSHSSSPLNPENAKLFPGENAQKESQDHIIAVAQQTVLTRKYMNGYQAELHKQMEAGEIDAGRFVEETHAIMMELRFTNPKHLQQVQEAQFKAIQKLNERNPKEAVKPVPLITTPEMAQQGNLAGVDKTISYLIPSLSTKDAIDRHVSNLRENLVSRGKPILPKGQFLKAA